MEEKKKLTGVFVKSYEKPSGNEDVPDKIEIFSHDDLKNYSPSEEEIEDFIDHDNPRSTALYVSLSVNAVKAAGYKMSDEEILKMCQTVERWYMEYKWPDALTQAEYLHDVKDILKKFLDLDDEDAWHEVELWSGFGPCPSKPEYTPEYESALSDMLVTLDPTYPYSDKEEV